MSHNQQLQREKAVFDRVEAPCPLFGTCGGCSLQDLAYQDQLALKGERIRQAFHAIDTTLPVEIRALDDPWRYRNKAELTFSEADGQLILGFHAARSYWKVIGVDDCLLLPEPMTALIRDVCRLARETGLPAYQPKTHRGFFRHLIARQSYATGQLLACVVTAPGSRDVMERMAEALMRGHSRLAGVYWGVRSSVADLAVPEELVLLRGAPVISDRIGPFELRVHPLSFLQPSAAQAERVYDSLVETLGEPSEGVAWDLYCGMGLVALYLAPRFRLVYGIDSMEQNIELAVVNAARNRVTNVEWRHGQIEDLLLDRRFWLGQARPEVVVVDPPRSGIHPRVLASVLAARPKRIVYLSCNVQTMVRDLRSLCAGYPRYQVRRLRAFDMFPQTNHVEVLALLER